MTHPIVKLNTSPYLAVHGKPPHGDGCWTFQVLDQKIYCGDYQFSAAVRKVKKWALTLYRDRGMIETPVITLLPEWRAFK